LAKFKRNFCSGPFERIFDAAIKTGKTDPSMKVEYSPRKNEGTWILPQVEGVTIYFGVSFENEADRAIAKLILYELEDAKRQLKNAPSVTKFFEVDKIPDILVKEFPGSKLINLKFGNGFVCINLFKSHYTTTSENTATMLQGFRQYLQYHIHASKTYLHGRIRKRVGLLQKTITQARFEEESKKIYRSAKGKMLKLIRKKKKPQRVP